MAPGFMRGTPAKSTTVNAVTQFRAEGTTERLFTVQKRDKSVDRTGKSH